MELKLDVESGQQQQVVSASGVTRGPGINEPAECSNELHKRSLLFKERQVEDGFVASRAKLLLYNMRMCCATICILCAGGILTDKWNCNPYHATLPKENVKVREFCWAFVWLVMVLGFILFFISPRIWSIQAKKLGGDIIGEYLCTFLTSLAVWSTICWNYKHAATLFGKSTEEVWGTLHVPVHKLEVLGLLQLFSVIAAINVVVPIRIHLLWIVEVQAVVAYALVYCNPQLVEDLFHAFVFAATCLIIYLGRWSAEKQERLHYLKMLEEKRLRFVAEHAVNPADSRLPSNAGHKEGSSNPSELPDSFFLYSVDGSSTHSKGNRTQAVHVVHETQTDLSWTLDNGFKCLRCSKPPKATSAQDEREKVRAAVQKYGKSSKIPKIENARRSSSSGSSEGRSTLAGSRQGSSGSGRSKSAENRIRTDNGPPQASSFCLTSAKAKKFMISDALLRWNCCRGGSEDCCPFHIAVGDALRVVNRLQKDNCNPLWMPLTGGQCATCGAMSDAPTDAQDDGDEFDACEFCGGRVLRTVPSDTLSVKSWDSLPSQGQEPGEEGSLSNQGQEASQEEQAQRYLNSCRSTSQTLRL